MDKLVRPTRGEAAAAAGVQLTVKFGLLIPDESNVRKTDKTPSPSLLASIETKGIKVPLLVRSHPGGALFSVIDGEKRLRAMAMLAKAGKVSPDAEVPIIVYEGTDADARDLSLTAAIIRDALHPVDRYEAVAALLAEGKTIEEIARDYTLGNVKTVHQVLSLAQLSDKVREAWRTGAINEETARKFTIAADHRQQDKVLAKLQKDGRVDQWAVRAQLLPSNSDTGLLVTFVGPEAYQAAGGKLVQDLFGTDHVIHHPAIAKKLADEKIAAIAEDLVKDKGWGWAATEEQLRAEGVEMYLMGRLDQPKVKPTAPQKARLKAIEARIEELQNREGGIDDGENDEIGDLEAEAEAIEQEAMLAGYPPEARAKAGVVLTLERHGKAAGTLRYHYGRLKPAAARREKAAASKAERAKSPRSSDASELSQALVQRLSETLTFAAMDAIVTAPHVAAAALIAGFVSGDQAVSVSENGLAGKRAFANWTPSGRRGARIADAEFAGEFEAAMSEGEKGRADSLARVAAAALNFQTFNRDRHAIADPAVKAICDALPSGPMATALLKHFDAADYFNSASATVVKTALKEMGVEYLASDKKPALAAAAVTAQKGGGWLPRELRTSHYAGPGSPAAVIHALHPKPARSAPGPRIDLYAGAGRGQRPKGASSSAGGGRAPAKGTTPAGRAPTKRARAK